VKEIAFICYKKKTCIPYYPKQNKKTQVEEEIEYSFVTQDYNQEKAGGLCD
jgi:hypothetical protein